MNIELITSVVIGCFIYNILLKAMGKVILDRILKTKESDFLEKAVKKTFEERLKEKQSEKEKEI